MFQELDRGFSIVRWVLQFLTVYFVPTILVGTSEMPFRTTDTALWQSSDYLIIALLGWWAAVAVCNYTPESAREGLWVWILPVSLFLSGVSYDLCCGPPSEILGLFFAAPGDPNLVPVL